MITGVFLYGLFLFFILIALFIWIIILIFREKPRIENDPIVINFLSHYSNGRAIGFEDNVIKAKNNRFISEFYPGDLDVKKINKAEKEKVIIGKDKIIPLPKGTLSKDRDIKIYLPPTAEDFPTGLKEHPFGKILMGYTELVNAVNSEIATIREGSKRKDEILQRLGDGELGKEYLDTFEGTMKDIIRMLAKEELSKQRRGFSGYYTPPSSSELT